jgi:hypothetical protein
MEEAPQQEQPETEKRNPNSIGELLSVGRDLPTRSDSVYRSVRDREAINDLMACGFVRNAQSAGRVQASRWGDRIFWSRGVDGKHHPVQKHGYVIEAPFAVAQERVVTRDDITAIYTKNERGEVFDILKKKEGEEEEQ